MIERVSRSEIHEPRSTNARDARPCASCTNLGPAITAEDQARRPVGYCAPFATWRLLAEAVPGCSAWSAAGAPGQGPAAGSRGRPHATQRETSAPGGRNQMQRRVKGTAET